MIPRTPASTSVIGDENDPGRVAEAKLAKENAETAEGTVPKKGGSGEGLYDALEDTVVPS